jgi:hypothetical protein
MRYLGQRSSLSTWSAGIVHVKERGLKTHSPRLTPSPMVIKICL